MVLLESTLGLDMNNIEANNAFVALADVEKLIDEHFDGDISPAVEDALVAKWGQIMGPEDEIVVCYYCYSYETSIFVSKYIFLSGCSIV